MTQSKKKAVARKGGRAGSSSGNDKLYVDQVRQLVDLMVANELTELEIVNGDLKIALGRGRQVEHYEPAYAPAHAHRPMAAPAAAAAAPAAAAEAKVEEGLQEITSPMVGVFYAAASPDAAPFVKAGDNVNGESVVCIIEAMKVMNEIKAECSGQIVEVCVKNAQPVEYGQVLFRVRP